MVGKSDVVIFGLNGDRKPCPRRPHFLATSRTNEEVTRAINTLHALRLVTFLQSASRDAMLAMPRNGVKRRFRVQRHQEKNHFQQTFQTDVLGEKAPGHDYERREGRI